MWERENEQTTLNRALVALVLDLEIAPARRQRVEVALCELRGHFVGKYLSGLALAYAATGDAELRARGDAMVKTLADCQTALNQGGYLSAFPL